MSLRAWWRRWWPRHRGLIYERPEVDYGRGSAVADGNEQEERDRRPPSTWFAGQGPEGSADDLDLE